MPPPVAHPGTVPAPEPEVTPERETEIQAWVDDNARAKTGMIFKDSEGGSRMAEAMRGEASLGAMNSAERQVLAEAAVSAWSGQDSGERQENMREAAEGVASDPSMRRTMAQALAAPELRAQQGIAQAGAIITTPEAREAAWDGLEQAIKLDAAAVVSSFGGLEPQLARIMQNRPDIREAVWTALGDRGSVPADQAERMTTALFMFEDGSGISSTSGRAGFAAAIANARRPGESAADPLARDQITDNLTDVLEDGDANHMIFDQEIPPEQRLWALDRAAGDGRRQTEGFMHGGWENEDVSRAYANEVTKAYRGRGAVPQNLSGEALRNIIGQAMGIQPDQLPQGELSEEFLARGLDNTFYSHGEQNAALDRVADRITELGGEQAQVSVVPVTITSSDEGAAAVPVFRVETGEGVKFVDHTGRSYSDLEDWEQNNTLPDGKMTYAKGLDLSSQDLTHRNTPGVVDSFAEGFGRVVDGVAIAAGAVAGVAIVAGSGGTAAPLVAAGAGLWMAGRAGQNLHDMQQHGQDIGDLSDPGVRGAWLEVAAGALSVGAIGGALRLGSAGARVSPGLARSISGVGMAAEGADMLALADQSIQLGQNWNELSGAERAGALLNIAFWGGMAGASHMAGRTASGTSGQGDFAALDLRIRSGGAGLAQQDFPLDVSVPGLAPGEMRVAYDMQKGRATNIRIQSGSAEPDAAQLELHMRVAAQMEEAGGLRSRLGGLLGGRNDPPVGSDAWEARLEIDKIATEAEQLAKDAGAANTLAERQRIATRQRELDQALTRETLRLDAAATDGQGFVAAPRSLDDILTDRVANGEIAIGLPDGMTPVTRPDASAQAEVDYGSINAKGQALGIEATLTKEWVDRDSGTSADGDIRPPGFPPPGVKNHPFSRGHLLAKRLGGSGDIPENLVTLYQSPANSPVHSDFERVVYDAVQAGETVSYRVTPIYEDGDLKPTALAISARGSEGLEFDITLFNKGNE
ncbi:DUF4781 domain-containing protein [Paracoccus alkanivorans]|uniref:DUF4781 domain-containing protein n=2 Tax=Paracoccus alkanivorans TaxID=2116655 RepID=A0A3M0MBF4_9RHOB|nr:DUF4781 domain-containing protein [Paracoccus alkanivorans]